MDLPRNPRYESLDAWRGVACLSVLVFHAVSNGYSVPHELKAEVLSHGGSLADWLATLTSYCWIGVPLFFVISGYCISASVDSARRKANPGRQFFIRRFRRIYPPMWVYLGLTAAVVACLPPQAIPGPTEGFQRPMPYPQEVSAVNWLGSLTLTEEWRHQLGGPPRGYFTANLWTLCYEEQFYIVAGVLLLFARRWFFAAVAAVSAAVFMNLTDWNALIGRHLGQDWNSYQLPGQQITGFFFDGMWLAFAAGVAVYYRANFATAVIRRCLDVGMLAMLYWDGRVISDWTTFRPFLNTYLFVSFAFALLLSWLHPLDARLASARILAPLRYCGKMCYSLYLVHAPVTILISWNLYRAGITTSEATLLVTLPAAAAASIVLAHLFHKYVETRFVSKPLKQREVGEPRADREAASTTPTAVPAFVQPSRPSSLPASVNA